MKIIFIVLPLIFVHLAIADLPVHCVKHQIVGEWTLQLQKPSLKGIFCHGILTCGHDIPDSEQTSFLAGVSSFKSHREINLVLSSKNHVKLPGSRKATGTWTMVYDEGFQVEHNHYVFFAFSKYKPEGMKVFSYCSETLVGWYQNKKTHERGCYRAFKAENRDQKSEAAQNGHVVQPSLFIEERKKQIWTLEDHLTIVDQINNNKNPNNKWKAKVYDKLVNRNLIELNSFAGRKRYFQGVKEEVLIQTQEIDYSHFSRQDISDLPKELNYEKFLGSLIREQGECGSCYTISTMAMLSSRLRMKGVDVELSPQYSLDCNYYNQGCDGGYPFLVEKWGTENFLVAEENYSYQGLSYKGSCKNDILDTLSVAYGVKSFKFIGGAYGRSNERTIMEELYKNGPVVLNFEPSFDFLYYSEGIYHSAEAADWILEGKKKPEWEKVDHSVLCYGWGEENGEKYWLLQNSWGEGWGEKGRFRMRRGTDESAIESMAEAAEPVVYNLSRHKKHKGVNQSLSEISTGFDQDEMNQLSSNM